MLQIFSPVSESQTDQPLNLQALRFPASPVVLHHGGQRILAALDVFSNTDKHILAFVAL